MPPVPPMPTITVRAALGQAPFSATPTYTDLPAFSSCSISRGRQSSLGLFETGTATLEWFNEDRRFDPWHTSGPYGTGLKPGTKVQISAVYGATSVYVYTGYVEKIRPIWPAPADAAVAIDLVDAFKLFERRRYRAGHYRSMVLSYSPRFYYQFKDGAGAGTAKDSSENNNLGTYLTRLLVDVDGVIETDPEDRALNCGANDGAVKGAAGLSGTGPVGIEMWFYLNALPGLGSFYQLFDQQILTGAPDEYVGLRVTDGGNVTFTEGSTGAAVITSANTVSTGTWNYVLWTRSGSAHTLHVNDVTMTPVLTTMDDYEQNEPHFGSDAGGTLRMDGSLDEVVGYVGAVPFSGVSGVGGDPLAHYREGSRAAAGGERTDQRIWSLLDEMGWPSADRNLSANGLYTLAPISGETSASFLGVMQQVIQTENGFLYMQEDGEIAFYPERALTPLPSSAFTLGEGSGEIHYREGPDAELSDEFIFNEFQLSGDAVPDVYLTDDSSVSDYGYRTLSQSGLLFEDYEDMQGRAERFRQQFREPKKRIRSVLLMGQDDPDVNFPAILGSFALGAVGTIKRRPIGGGSTISQLSEVEHVTHQIGADTWACTVRLSPLS